ncbi:095aa7da-b3bb-497d-8a9e-9fc169def14b [Sclerotinia trifoliorum]|uniref:095aa7da-b3bb-497d-8a9e-9fc169def14b n=1 Tax=Sclerotinia trifoliorum TaxID=28548 RepID=A0A8H2ZTU3_9HELO|nr:095aa7da-b3bb-497d-8a9e-9fc169def14b [Sclerotinia trifoliorum]
MSPILKTVATFEEFSLVVDCLWESNIDPFNPFMNIIVRIKEPTAEGVAAAVQEMKECLWKTHKADKYSVWVYIVDEYEHGEEPGKVLAGAEWLFHEVNPFEEKKDDEKQKNKNDEIENGEKKEEGDNSLGSWWPEELSMMFTHPDHRCRGSGSLLMEYGMRKTTEMNVEALVEATAGGLPLYEKFGFRTIEIITIDTACRGGKPGFLWLKMANEIKGKTT